jgi:hypothetical protein
MPCIIKDGVLQKYQPYTERKELETGEGVIAMEVSEVGVKVPEGVTSIGPRAFAGCESLQYVDLPEGVVDIAAYAFKDCKHLKRVTLPSTVQKVGAYAFAGCRDLEQIALPAGLEQLGSYAFSYCQSLKQVSGLSTRIISLRGYELFLGCPLMKRRA